MNLQRLVSSYNLTTQVEDLESPSKSGGSNRLKAHKRVSLPFHEELNDIWDGHNLILYKGRIGF